MLVLSQQINLSKKYRKNFEFHAMTTQGNNNHWKASSHSAINHESFIQNYVCQIPPPLFQSHGSWSVTIFGWSLQNNTDWCNCQLSFEKYLQVQHLKAVVPPIITWQPSKQFKFIHIFCVHTILILHVNACCQEIYLGVLQYTNIKYIRFPSDLVSFRFALIFVWEKVLCLLFFIVLLVYFLYGPVCVSCRLSATASATVWFLHSEFSQSVIC